MYTPTNSLSQGTMIVPVPENPNRYIVFSLACMEMISNYGNLYYFVVNMTLNNGLGDICSWTKGILLGRQFTEHMTSMLGVCTERFIWLVTVSRQQEALVAFIIDRYGIDVTPVYTPLQHDILKTTTTGTLTPSIDQSKLVFSSYITERFGGVAVFDFDKANGTFVNERVLDTFSSYSSTFSPDGSKLYYSSMGDLYQINMNAGNLGAIINSKHLVRYGLGLTDMKIALNNKVYFKSPTTNRGLACINNPNSLGSAAVFVDSAIMLEEATFINLGLPNHVADLQVDQDTIFTSTTYFTCKNDNLQLESLLKGNISYRWHDGSLSKYI